MVRTAMDDSVLDKLKSQYSDLATTPIANRQLTSPPFCFSCPVVCSCVNLSPCCFFLLISFRAEMMGALESTKRDPSALFWDQRCLPAATLWFLSFLQLCFLLLIFDETSLTQDFLFFAISFCLFSYNITCFSLGLLWPEFSVLSVVPQAQTPGHSGSVGRD